MLTNAKARNATRPGKHRDERGLYLLVSKPGDKGRIHKSWVFRFMLHGKTREMGLGGFPTFSVDEARERARKQRQLITDGVDPLEVKRQLAQERLVEIARRTTFEECAEEFIEAKRSGWKNEKHAWQWRQTLQAHAFPKLGKLPVAAVDTELVMTVLRPIWQTIPETANRLRNRIERILDFAAVRGYRDGPNPAKWDGVIEYLLPSRGELARSGKAERVQHFEALPWQEVPAFVAKLRARRGRTGLSELTAIQVEWVVLTACRVNELRGAGVEEFDWEQRLWVIPAERMKAGRTHVIPLSDRLGPLWEESEWRAPMGNGKLFPVSDTAMRRLAKQIAGRKVTIHGFRSSFRDWCSANRVDRDIAELCLAHEVKDKTEAAYNRTKLVDQRREVMEAWAAFVYNQ